MIHTNLKCTDNATLKYFKDGNIDSFSVYENFMV